MASNSADFVLNIEQRLKGASAVSELDKAEEAVRSSISSYRALETAAEKTTKSLEANGARLGAAQDKLAKIAAGSKDGSVNVAAYRKQEEAVKKLAKAQQELHAADSKSKGAMNAQRDVVSKQAGIFEKLRGAQQKVGSASKATGADLFSLKDSLAKLGGPAGNGASKVLELGESMSKLGKAGGGAGLLAGGLVVAVAVIAIVVVAIAAATAAMLKFGIATANAARSQRLTNEAFLISVEGGKELGNAMKRVAVSTGIASDRQKDIIRSLREAKVSAGDIPTALEAIALSESAIGDSTGTQKMIDSLKSGEKTAKALGKEMEKQYGGIVQKKMMSLEATGARLEKNFAIIGGGLNVEGLLGALAKVADSFDENSAAGRALKMLFETIFQPLTDAVASTIPYIQLFFLRFARVIVMAATVVAPLVKRVAEFFGLSPSDAIELTLKAATFAAATLVAGIGLVIAIVAVLIGSVVAAAAAVAAPVIAVGAAFYGVYLAAKAAYEKVTTVGWSGLGKAIVDGIVAGIKAAGAAIVNAVGGLADSAISTAKKKLRIKSPSKVFEEIGQYTGEGFAGGVESSKPMVRASVDDMLALPGSGARAGVAKANGAKGLTIEIRELHVHGEMSDSTVAKTKLAVISLLEDAMVELGLGPAEATP